MSSGSYWRDRAAPIIREVIARVGRDDPKALKKALREAYPFGERRLWPYKIWCSEIRRQLEGRQQPDSRRREVTAPGQLSLIPDDAATEGRP